MGAPKLNDAGIDKAVRLLDGWVGLLTWDRYLAMLEVEIGHKYTKAAMLRQPRIKSAWDHAKEHAKDDNGVVRVSRSAVETDKALERVKLLEARVERLTRENNALLEQFVRWSHNAVRGGLTLDDLDRPLPYAKPKEIR